MTAARQLSIAAQIGRGLSFLHSRNIAHRDLKSANVLYDRELKVKLCDFAFSKFKKQGNAYLWAALPIGCPSPLALWPAVTARKLTVRCTGLGAAPPSDEGEVMGGLLPLLPAAKSSTAATAGGGSSVAGMGGGGAEMDSATRSVDGWRPTLPQPIPAAPAAASQQPAAPAAASSQQ